MGQKLRDSRWHSGSVAEDGLRPGNVLADRFRLLESMGGGRMCEIWHAEDMSLGREVAIKTVRVGDQTDPNAYTVLLREGKLLARIHHPGVLQIHDVGSDRGVVFLVTQLIPGRPLDRVIAELAARTPGGPGDLDPKDVQELAPNTDTAEPGDWFLTGAHLMVELLRALEAVHGSDMVHRDVKPANVLLTATGKPVLVDFGFSGDRGDHSSSGLARLSCTPNYVAPEQLARMSSGQDVRTDIYQAGLLMYELLTLKKCFDGETSFELYDRIVSRRFETPSQVDSRVPRALEAICLKAIALSPKDRYRSAAEFRADIERFLQGGPVAALGPEIARPGTQAVAQRRGKMLRFFAVAPLVAVLAGLVRVWLRDI